MHGIHCSPECLAFRWDGECSLSKQCKESVREMLHVLLMADTVLLLNTRINWNYPITQYLLFTYLIVLLITKCLSSVLSKEYLSVLQYTLCDLMPLYGTPLMNTITPPQTVDYEEGSADDESLKEMVELAVQRLYDALNPSLWATPGPRKPSSSSPAPPIHRNALISQGCRGKKAVSAFTLPQWLCSNAERPHRSWFSM